MSTRPNEATAQHGSEKRRVLEQFPEPRRNTREATGDAKRHTDARSIREYHSVPAWDGDAPRYDDLLPNILEYEWDVTSPRIAGGTDLLTTGKPGSGKSTLANNFALRAIEINRAKAVWRASQSRSEWLPLAPWATLCLPAGLDVDARLVPRRPTDQEHRITLEELEDHIVREVVRYDSPRDLNKNVLEQGQIHVVYPDPLMRGTQAAYERSDEKQYDAPTDRPLFHETDPSNHWWFSWVLDRVENGPHHWTTLILDEIGDLAPEDARKDNYGTYQKVELLQDCWVDARKKGLTVYAFGHAERDIHNKIRHKIRWRCSMNSSANPTSAGDLVGFESVPMEKDQCSWMDVGEALLFSEQHFEKIKWPNYSTPVDHKLELSFGGGA